jgi:hypothetical protein
MEAERLPYLATLAVISVAEPGLPLTNLEEDEHVFWQSFADVNFLNGNNPLRAKKKLKHAFTPGQASRMTEFIEELPAEIVSIVFLAKVAIPVRLR